MEVCIENNKLAIITEPTAIYFDLPKEVGRNWKNDTGSIIKHSEYLAEH